MSGFNEQEAIDRFTGKGLAGFLQKPFRTEQLRAKLRQLLAGA
jgi:CheY-like chemotaxis protein